MARRWLLLGLLSAFNFSTAQAGDWPQWRGDGHAIVADFKAPAEWPKDLSKKWSKSIGDGVATPALAGGKLYTFGYQSGNEVIRCFDATTGDELWKDEYPARAAGGPAKDFPGARSSPAVADGKVVTLGVQGTLSCWDAEKGKKVWRKDSTGGVPGFSASCSPLLVDGLCVVQIGGDRGGAAVAYNLSDGNEKWKWNSDGTKYASPALLTVGDLKAVVVETSGTMSALTLAGGKFLWSANFSSRYNAASPAVEGSIIYYSGSSQPMRAVKLEKDGEKLVGKELWPNKDGTSIYSTPVVKDGLLYGLSERNEIFCIDTKDGKTLWTKRFGSGGGGGGGGGGGRGGRSGYGSIVAAGSSLFALTPAGQLVVFKPDREEYKEIASYKVADGNTYAYPVVTSEGVYVRDKDSVAFWKFK